MSKKTKSINLKQVTGIRIMGVIGATALLAFMSPLIWMAVTGATGLITLGVVVATGIMMFQALPLMGQKVENKILALRKAEARKRPIEQLQNYLLQKSQGVKNFKEAVTQIGTQIRGMRDMVDDRIRTKPSWDPSKKEAALRQMNDAHQVLIQTYKNAEKALEELKDIIDEKKFDWKFGQAGADAIEIINATSGEDLVEKMLADEAFDAVRDNFNHVFSALDMEAAKLTSTPSLSFDDGMTIDLSKIQLPAHAQLRT